jgi:hypothetical protein
MGKIHFYLIINQIIMKTQQTNISEVRLVYRTKVKLMILLINL